MMFKHFKKVVAIGALIWGLFEIIVKVTEAIRDYNKPEKPEKV